MEYMTGALPGMFGGLDKPPLTRCPRLAGTYHRSNHLVLRSSVLRACILCIWLLLGTAAPAFAAPYMPTHDAQVLERLPRPGPGSAAGELASLRRELARQPRNAELAVRLATRYMAEVAAEGDPRFVGYAQAALAPWWTAADAPVDVRVMRAVVLQFNHHFDAAQADLEAAVKQQPDHVQAWAWTAAIAMVRADYPRARRACEQLAPLVEELNAVACTAAVDSVTGRAAPAAAALRNAIDEADEASPDERLWALTRLAETLERLGDYAAAERAFRQALALGVSDGYLLAAYADFLLDRGRPAEVIALLRGKERSDLLLLRLALAAKVSGDPALAGWSGSLAQRFDAARLRGDETHQKEEARYALHVLGDAARALPLAQANFVLQREPADARMLLEAALAARQPAAAASALNWMRDSKVESRALSGLADRLGALK